MKTPCREGGEHEVVSASFEDRDRYDPTVLGQYDQYAGPRPNQLWGYCIKCREGMRWSVSDQQWRPWPGGLALLPHLNDEELDELGVAIVRRGQELMSVARLAQNPDTVGELVYKARILMSLHTAVQEARYQLWPPEGTYAPRFWGEAWPVLRSWLNQQIEGVQRSSATDLELGAISAFEAVIAKIDELDQSGDDSIRATRAADIERVRGGSMSYIGIKPASDDAD